MKAQLGDDSNTEIKVWDRAFPGVVVRLGEHSREVMEERDALRFHVEENRLLEH